MVKPPFRSRLKAIINNALRAMGRKLGFTRKRAPRRIAATSKLYTPAARGRPLPSLEQLACMFRALEERTPASPFSVPGIYTPMARDRLLFTREQVAFMLRALRKWRTPSGTSGNEPPQDP